MNTGRYVLSQIIELVDLETGKEFVFLTNNLEVPALTVAMLYKLRWHSPQNFAGFERSSFRKSDSK